MKKLLLIFALVAVYGISISSVSAHIFTDSEVKTSIAADTDNIITPTLEDDKKDKKKTEKTTTAVASETKTESTSCCSAAQKKSCAASGKSCNAEKTKEKKK
jgi:hypothetical protein